MKFIMMEFIYLEMIFMYLMHIENETAIIIFLKIKIIMMRMALISTDCIMNMFCRSGHAVHSSGVRSGTASHFDHNRAIGELRCVTDVCCF